MTMKADGSLLAKEDAKVYELKITLTDEFDASRTFRQTVMCIHFESIEPAESKNEPEATTTQTIENKQEEPKQQSIVVVPT
jgi:hypothetical protein